MPKALGAMNLLVVPSNWCVGESGILDYEKSHSYLLVCWFWRMMGTSVPRRITHFLLHTHGMESSSAISETNNTERQGEAINWHDFLQVSLSLMYSLMLGVLRVLWHLRIRARDNLKKIHFDACSFTCYVISVFHLSATTICTPTRKTWSQPLANMLWSGFIIFCTARQVLRLS